ncbi:ELL complex subunit [Kipferlia bialata]|uniref:Vacuolar protein-sorting-associated protein 36 n=1 Tax=Kipferlia bialata TaxID=797122 RepID=A0A9K3CM17_9EUKA|nr:ELL complex subunit [Kipferlia bialata]|eukprot:g112.t1
MYVEEAVRDRSSLSKVKLVLTDEKAATALLSHIDTAILGAAQATSSGLGRLKQVDKARQRDRQSTLDAAFEKGNEFTGLEENLEKLVALAAKLKGLSSSEAESDFATMVTEIDTVATVHKGQKDYEQHLAEDVCRVLVPRLNTTPGGMTTLIEAYALYNRARAGDLISPTDFKGAVALIKSAEASGQALGLVHRSVGKGGLTVLQLRDAATAESDAASAVLERLAEMEDRDSRLHYVTAVDVAQILSLSVPLADCVLLRLEEACTVCRDEGPNGLVFYRNVFMDEAFAGDYPTSRL